MIMYVAGKPHCLRSIVVTSTRQPHTPSHSRPLIQSLFPCPPSRRQWTPGQLKWDRIEIALNALRQFWESQALSSQPLILSLPAFSFLCAFLFVILSLSHLLFLSSVFVYPFALIIGLSLIFKPLLCFMFFFLPLLFTSPLPLPWFFSSCFFPVSVYCTKHKGWITFNSYSIITFTQTIQENKVEMYLRIGPFI